MAHYCVVKLIVSEVSIFKPKNVLNLVVVFSLLNDRCLVFPQGCQWRSPEVKHRNDCLDSRENQ